MKRCQVLIPFYLKATGVIYKVGDIIEVSDEQLAKIQEPRGDTVKVLAEVEKPKKTRKTKQ